MPISYDKWDRLEVSDDSDVEVHPNVDTKSFIRAKQRQIHEQRAQRKHEIETLKYERIINDGLLERINALLDALKKHQADASTKNPDELVFQSLIESAGDPAKDEPPKPPEGVYTHQQEQPRYSKMMGALVDQVKKEVDEKNSTDRYKDFIEGVNGHLTKVQKLQQDLLQRLAQLEKEAHAKITSEDIHVGFDSSFINKPKPKPSSEKSKKKEKTTTESVELLNAPKGLSSQSRDALKSPDGAISSGAEADVEDDALLEKGKGQDEEDDEEDETSLKLTPEGQGFAKIKLGDYRACLQYISEHPEIVNERTQDALMIEAFNAQMKGQDAYAKQCVHQSLLIQYCRQLGRDGVGVFFKRITTKGHQAQEVFNKDLAETYGRIKTRAAELSKEEGNDPAGVEQIQLHAVEPGTEIHINVPQAGSDDPVEQQAREIFDRFPPGLQRALESGSLDEVNKVLGKMSVDEAEEIVELLGQGGMLSLQEGVIDATNEEGQKRLKEIEEEERRKKAEKGKEVEAEGEGEGVGEPGEAVEA
ncbi:Hsp90 co-chaperone Cdc37 [Exophiala dermatitidis]|uniref:Hsp90 chaperone protein kinase-targeting subunit n=2 Tax=Exophiala dermatitidis TaxID=5970 RepID=H6C2D6_EXODN|nr:cell division cycle protein 37 [Exophiala dermatitidis NIH/UT8656]AAT69235.1 CDC37 [Exophiala dermatitidis]EHY57908.1 cell division cycle protein 37 [Exophiala dermatitidis NIH/UT8656]